MLRSLVGSEMCIRDRVTSSSSSSIQAICASSHAATSTVGAGGGSISSRSSCWYMTRSTRVQLGQYAASCPAANSSSEMLKRSPHGHIYVKLSLIHISEPTRLLSISYAVFCLKKKKKK
eukprot:TRINITY_DN9604_c0_g1_i5.p2 TRINITY_DN9604_c0_g1~~TRINITY_DN9604_c0_g1_i5.p2  ORF type:complete len:119 (-),score=44.10 TRINITY_DN9604_c0_g1_i5:70-426(-)